MTDGYNSGDGFISIDPPSAIANAAFGYTGAPQFYAVPENVTDMFIRLYGAGAGSTGEWMICVAHLCINW